MIRSIQSSSYEVESAKSYSKDDEKSMENVTAGPVLFSSSRDRTIKMWDAFGKKCIHTFVGHDNWVKQVVTHPSGKYIASCSDDRSIRIWDIISSKCLKVLMQAHPRFVSTICFNQKSFVLASGSLDCSIKIWVSKGKE